MSQEKCEVCGVELHWSPLVEGLPQMSTVSDCRHVVQLREPSMTPIPPIPEDPPEICKEYCKDCEAETATWFTDSDIWNLLDTPGILCLNCFVHLIEARGFATTGWKLVPEERIAKLTAELSDEEREHERTIIQRDAAEEALSDAYLSVTGHEAIWSNLFGYREALNGICEEVHSLRAENTRLKAPVSDEEWSNVYGYSADDEYASRESTDSLIASRATRTPPQEGQ